VCEPVIGCETQVVRVGATGGGHMAVPPDDELLDDELLEE
jgi:hypothetical protein